MLTDAQMQILNARLDILFGKISVREGRPTINFNNRLRTTAGRAFYELNLIELNPKLYFGFLMDDTLPHEYAHLISWSFYKEAGHGDQWRRACHALGMREVTRCHDQDVSAHKTKQRRWEYRCGCQTHKVATVTHNRIQNGTKGYKCKACAKPITFTGKECE